jgi:uncharacterized protein related to proFAR isomerase
MTLFFWDLTSCHWASDISKEPSLFIFKRLRKEVKFIPDCGAVLTLNSFGFETSPNTEAVVTSETSNHVSWRVTLGVDCNSKMFLRNFEKIFLQLEVLLEEYLQDLITLSYLSSLADVMKVMVMSTCTSWRHVGKEVMVILS